MPASAPSSRFVFRGVAAIWAVLGYASTGAAYCRTTTCDASLSQVGCQVDEETGCSLTGEPLYWAERCLSFGVQEGGSPRQHITWQTADGVISGAFQQWLGADCGGGQHPSFEMWDLDGAYGPMICDQVQFNQDAPNANIWMFRDDTWPHSNPAATLALTTVTFEKNSGAILDADVEINSGSHAHLSTGIPTPSQSDLRSIVTHEAGHFLGLAHSNQKVATMYANYSAGDISFRTLSKDDMEGICAVYPPARATPACSQPEPDHGFSKYCASPDPPRGCSVALRPENVGKGAPVTLLALGWIWRRRRRRGT